MTRVQTPASAQATAETLRAGALRFYTAMSGTTTLDALALAEAEVDRMPTKAQLRMAIRSAQAVARELRRRDTALSADPFAIPAMPGVGA